MARLDPMVSVNMTPLVDVMLVVLVLFLITSPLLWPGPEVTLPNVRAEVVKLDETTAVVSVQSDGAVFFREARVDGRLERALLADPDFVRNRRLYVRGDRDARFGQVARVLELAHRLDARGVNLVVDPELLGAGVP